MSPRRALAFGAAGLVAGAAAGLFGIGGGILFVPILTAFFGKRTQDAAATSLAVIIVISVVGTLTYHSGLRSSGAGDLRWDLALYMLIGSVAGSTLIGVPLASKVSSAALRRYFGAFLMLVGLRMALAPHYGEGALPSSPFVVIAGGLIAGALSGFFGIGGGIVAVPVLVMAFGLAQRVAQATSILVAGPTGLAGVLRARFTPNIHVDYRAAALMAPTSILGTWLGARLATISADQPLQQAFGVVTVVIGARMVGLMQTLAKRREAAAASEEGPA